MKKFFVFFLLFLFLGIAFIKADIYIRQKFHRDAYYNGGVINPEMNSKEELWIGEKRMTSINGARTIIIDLEQNKAILLFHGAKIFTETSLPFEYSKIVSESYASRLKSAETEGSVIKTNEKKKIGQWECRCYNVYSFFFNQGSKLDETDTKRWVTTDVPFDVEMYNRMNTTLVKMGNYDDDFLRELEKIKGFPIASESILYVDGSRVHSSLTVEELTEKDAPSHIYSVPEAYTEKTTLSYSELRYL